MNYSTEELMACFLANEIEDGATVTPGANSPIARTAVLLAHFGHAPNLKIMLGFTWTNLTNEKVVVPAAYLLDWRSARWAEAYYTHEANFDNMRQRRDWVFFIGGIQVDMYGNSNLIGIKDSNGKMKMRGPGSTGSGNMASFAGRYYLLLNRHDQRTLVESCDYISALGWGTGGADARTKMGLPGGGPKYCLSPLGVMDFESKTKRMRLIHTHPGISVRQVVEATGFELLVSPNVTNTPEPTAEQLKLLRERVDTRKTAN